MACVVVAYVVMAYTVMAYVVMAYIVMAYVVMAYVAIHCVIVAHVFWSGCTCVGPCSVFFSFFGIGIDIGDPRF